MEREKTATQKTRSSEKSTPKRIPNQILSELKYIGKGDWKRGLIETLSIYKLFASKPENIIMKDVDSLMSHLKQYYDGNHFDHFDNFPAVMRMFLKTGNPDFSIMTSKKVDKNIEEYNNEKTL